MALFLIGFPNPAHPVLEIPLYAKSSLNNPAENGNGFQPGPCLVQAVADPTSEEAQTLVPRPSARSRTFQFLGFCPTQTLISSRSSRQPSPLRVPEVFPWVHEHYLSAHRLRTSPDPHKNLVTVRMS